MQYTSLEDHLRSQRFLLTLAIHIKNFFFHSIMLVSDYACHGKNLSILGEKMLPAIAKIVWNQQHTLIS